MKYKVKIEVLDNLMEFSYPSIQDGTDFVYLLSNVIACFGSISNTKARALLNELDTCLQKATIKTKKYKIFYADDSIRISAKLL